MPSRRKSEAELVARQLTRFEQRNAARVEALRNAPPPDQEEISIERIEHARYLMAQIILTTGKTKFVPLLDRLDRELEARRELTARLQAIIADPH